MSAIYVCAAVNLLADTCDRMVTVSFTELLDDQPFGLLNGAPCQYMTSTDGAAFPYPCVEVHVKDAKELLLLLEMARNLRATAAQRRCSWRCLREELR